MATKEETKTHKRRVLGPAPLFGSSDARGMQYQSGNRKEFLPAPAHPLLLTAMMKQIRSPSPAKSKLTNMSKGDLRLGRRWSSGEVKSKYMKVVKSVKCRNDNDAMHRSL